jgi:hypothetical protein
MNFRIHLKQGTPAIQKLWAAGKLIGTLATHIRQGFLLWAWSDGDPSKNKLLKQIFSQISKT